MLCPDPVKTRTGEWECPECRHIVEPGDARQCRSVTPPTTSKDRLKDIALNELALIRAMLNSTAHAQAIRPTGRRIRILDEGRTEMIQELSDTKTYTHVTKGGRYRIMALPLSSGELREEGMEVVVYRDVASARIFARKKSEFITKMVEVK